MICLHKNNFMWTNPPKGSFFSQLLFQYTSGITFLNYFTEEIPEEEAPVDRSQNEPDDKEEMVEGEDLLTRIERIQARKGVLCEPAAHTPVMN